MSINQNNAHDSAVGHVTGTSVFIDDRSFVRHEVLVGIIGTPVCSGVLKKIDFQDCLKIQGVIAVFTAADLPHNKWGTIKEEQPLLVTDKIGHMDEPICLVAYDPKYPQAFQSAKKKIKFEIEAVAPIQTIEDALAQNELLYTPTTIQRGNFIQAFAQSPNTLTGELFIKGQEHFYMESQAVIVYPAENGQLEVHASSQHPSETQRVCAHALGLNLSDVTCVVKRMGGGFGGKESQAAHYAALAALVAHKLKRPARLCLTKDEDMLMTGKRHPFKNYYEVGFNDEGKILALKFKLIADGGSYTDLTPSILDRALFHADGCYYLENICVEGVAVRTNHQSHTAFRGFGGPQGNLAIESLIEDIAIYLKKDSYEIRRLNLYQETNNTTHYGQEVTHNVLPEIFDTLHKEAEYKERLQSIIEFNEKKCGKIRGLSLTGCKFGIAFTARFLNQGNALAHIHLDGTLQVSTGATEMGQGVNTKIAQIAAGVFGIETKCVRVMATSTEKNHNTSPTAASSGADINGAATLKACLAIAERLRFTAHLLFSGAEFTDTQELSMRVEHNETAVNGANNATENQSWSSISLSHIEFKNSHVIDTKNNHSMPLTKLLQVAYLNRVQMGEYAFFRTEGLGYNKKTGQGTPFKYFTNGAAISEVEIDEYTGELKILRADILMDLGHSLNPSLDKGQVSGAFVQGFGWLTTENLVYNSAGKLLSHSPTTYKIPNIQDTPRIFNVKLIENNFDTGSVHRSKAVGEPPLLLGTSVWTAIKHAISFRIKGIPNISAPATAEVILMTLSQNT